MVANKNKPLKILLILTCILALQACGSDLIIDEYMARDWGARANEMTVNATPDTLINETNELYQAMEVVGVSGGHRTNDLWTSQIGIEEFEQALLNSLRAHAMISDGDAKYKLTATLEEFGQPLSGYTTTVKSTIRYELVNVASQQAVYNEVVENEYTATTVDELLGAPRFQLATEGVIRENISSFIKTLIEKSEAGLISTASDQGIVFIN